MRRLEQGTRDRHTVHYAQRVSGERVGDGQFVNFGPEQARKAREAAGMPEPDDGSDLPDDAGPIRRLWAFLTRGSGDLRKLWSSERT
jgi:hypothetical protein